MRIFNFDKGVSRICQEALRTQYQLESGEIAVYEKEHGSEIAQIAQAITPIHPKNVIGTMVRVKATVDAYVKKNPPGYTEGL